MEPPKLLTVSERLSLFWNRVPADAIREVRALLLDHQIDVSVRELSAHARDGGDVREVASALAEARLRKVSLDFRRACALDLARERTDPMQRPVNLVRRAASPEEMFFDPKGPMLIAAAGRFTWRPRLRARLAVNLDTFFGGALRDLIEIRLKLALRGLYHHAAGPAAADAALAAWLEDPKRREALTEGTRYRILALERVL